MDTETSKLLFKKVFNVKVISDNYVSKLDKKLYEQFMSSSGGQSLKGMVLKFAAILEQTPTDKRNDLLSSIEEDNPDLLEDIKANMLSFENLVKLKDEELQLILSNVDMKDLSYALQSAEDDVKEKIQANISSRAKSILDEELEAAKERADDDSINAAQLKILGQARSLQSSGKVTLKFVDPEQDGDKKDGDKDDKKDDKKDKKEK